MKTFSNSAKAEPRRAVPCALCGGNRVRPLWELDGYSFARCPACGLTQQNPQPEPASVIGRYAGDYLKYELDNEGPFLALALKALRDAGFAAEAGLDFLDVGCATGALLQKLSESGVRARGVEPCAETSGYARTERGLEVFTGTLDEARYPDGAFDVVHASHVIEHVNDPAAFLSEARRTLKGAGRLILTTPNVAGFQARVFGPAWRSAINDHLYLFSFQTLSALLEKRGFRVVRHKTWGGWARGARPAFIKAPLDSLAKAFGFGDVMVIMALRA